MEDTFVYKVKDSRLGILKGRLFYARIEREKWKTYPNWINMLIINSAIFLSHSRKENP